MLLRKLCEQIRSVQLRRCSTLPKNNEPIPTPRILQYATQQWQQKHLREIKRLLAGKKISDALTYFYREVKVPSQSHISVLMSAVGKTGHTRLAFKLLKEMRSRNIKPTPAVLTSLFNSCANNKEDRRVALSHADGLYEQMSLKGWHGSHITYHSMIKAFAMHGETETCFKLMDEMIEKRLPISCDTYTHLLMACVGDKKMGFVLAVKVMRMMLWARIKPTVAAYNTLLRATLDCGCGDNVELLNKLLNEAKQTKFKDPKLLQICAGVNLLDTRLDDSVVSVAAIPKTIDEKLALIGGVSGIVTQMEYFRLKPEAKTYSLMIRCITTEKEMMDFFESLPRKKLDIGFYNQLLKRCIVEKWKCANYIETRVYRSGLLFDVLTYGIFAMRVDTPERLESFMRRMDKDGLVPNEVIMSTLLNNLGRNFRFNAVLKLLKYCHDNEIALNGAAIKNLAKTLDINTRNAGVNSVIKGLLRKIKVADDVNSIRVQQFDPAVFKRNKRKWDPYADDEDIEERDKELEQEAEEHKTLLAKHFASSRRKQASAN